MKTNPNDPIDWSLFEKEQLDGEGCVTKRDENPGLTKREYFAAMALQGILSSERGGNNGTVEAAVAHADLLIEALNR